MSWATPQAEEALKRLEAAQTKEEKLKILEELITKTYSGAINDASWKEIGL